LAQLLSPPPMSFVPFFLYEIPFFFFSDCSRVRDFFFFFPQSEFPPDLEGLPPLSATRVPFFGFLNGQAEFMLTHFFPIFPFQRFHAFWASSRYPSFFSLVYLPLPSGAKELFSPLTPPPLSTFFFGAAPFFPTG